MYDTLTRAPRKFGSTNISTIAVYAVCGGKTRPKTIFLVHPRKLRNAFLSLSFNFLSTPPTLLVCPVRFSDLPPPLLFTSHIFFYKTCPPSAFSKTAHRLPTPIPVFAFFSSSSSSSSLPPPSLPPSSLLPPPSLPFSLSTLSLSPPSLSAPLLLLSWSLR